MISDSTTIVTLYKHITLRTAQWLRKTVEVPSERTCGQRACPSEPSSSWMTWSM